MVPEKRPKRNRYFCLTVWILSGVILGDQIISVDVSVWLVLRVTGILHWKVTTAITDHLLA